jgi:predicted ATPase/class 3 adenylate cyclase
MPDRPTGTVTFLFSDIERSTALLERLGAPAYAEELAHHRAALRASLANHGGTEIDTQGDAFFVAFATAADALAAARDAQAELAGAPMRVRIGLHTGEPLVTDDGYVGMDVHRAARIAAAAHGGQIVVSQTTRDLLGADDLVALGPHRLKDLTRPERLYQVGSEQFPPPKSLNASTLPEVATPLVGREEEQFELADLLGASRLVTITGAGGTGKTRLALQVAAELADAYSDGVRFVPFASLTDPRLVLPVALQALGLTEADDPHGIRALVVLDNLEHLLVAGPAIASYLARGAGPTFLVTSRRPLHLSMEHEFALDPLPHEAAVELFLDRARAVRRGVAATPEVDEICHRLDGLPLALELAAARLKLLDPASLAQRLDSRLALLTHGPNDLPERQRTLEATIAWSFELLAPDAQRVFAALSVFSGTFDLDAAERVADADLDTVGAVVDASLLKARGDCRFLMLETVREFAQRLLDPDEAARLGALHAEHYLALAEDAEPHLTGPDAAARLGRIEADYGNHRAALDRLAAGSPPLARRLVLCLWRFWLTRGRFDEGAAAFARALALDPPAEERAELRYRLGALVVSRGDAERARELFTQALQGFRAGGDDGGVARSLSAIGHVAADVGDWAEAIRRYEEAAAMFRAAGHDYGLAGVLGDLATLHLRSGAPERARPLAAESIELHRRVGNRQGESLALATQGYADLAAGDVDEARAALAASAAVARELGYLHGLMFSLNGLGAVAARSGDVDGAAEAFASAQELRESLRIDHDPDDVLVAEDRARAFSPSLRTA